MGFDLAEFSKILKLVEAGEALDTSHFLPFLSLPLKEDRYDVNLQLADAFFRRYERQADAAALSYARACIDRALLLSHYAPEVLPLLIRIYQALGNTQAVKDGLKRVGIEQAARGNFDQALALFDRWIYANFEFANIDTHTFDPEIIACVERMAALHRFDAPLLSRTSGKVRLAYLMHGLTHDGSVLVKIDQVFARHHDKARFEVAYFSADDEASVASSQHAQAAVRNIRDSGCQMFVAPKSATVFEGLLAVGKQIRDFKPDILITTAALATFRNFLIASLRPAPVAIAFNQGSTPQFSWHSFDHTISWCLTTFLDCPSDSSNVPLELDLPARAEITPMPRAQLNIPDSAALMVSGGRWHKFQNRSFWQGVAELLHENNELYWLVVGTTEDKVAFISEIISPEVRRRIQFYPWSSDYLKVLAIADFFLDSYPVGGGVMLIEAMSLGLPALSFEHDYISLYNNDDCSGGYEIVAIPELVVPRGDFGELKQRAGMLARDVELRRCLGDMCRERAWREYGQPARMVRRFEGVYEQVLRESRARAEATAPAANRHELLPARPNGSVEYEAYHRLLIEQTNMLNRREADLVKRETQINAPFFRRLRRGLHLARLKLRQKRVIKRAALSDTGDAP